MPKLFRFFCLPIILLMALISSSLAAESVYTSVAEKDCVAPSPSVTYAYKDADVTVQQCPAPKSWALYVVSSDERSWVDVGHASEVWSTERPVVHDNDFGHFPNIGGKLAEWIVEGEVPVSLIFRISAQDPEAASTAGEVRKTSRLFVVSLRGKEPTFCGIAKTNEKARALAATPDKCKIPLQRTRSDKR